MEELFEDLKTLKEEYITAKDFTDKVSSLFGTDLDLSDIAYDSKMKSTFSQFIINLAKAIYFYYQRDKIAYTDKDVFIERIVYDLTLNINHYFQRKGIDFMIGSNTDNDKYLLSNGMTTKSSEDGVSGSSVLQSTASTPTGVSPSATGNTIEMNIDGTTLNVTNNGYVDKFTNFQGKTNGLHNNKVNRDTSYIRTANYEQAIELFTKLPVSYLEEVLRDVSNNFIFTY